MRRVIVLVVVLAGWATLAPLPAVVLAILLAGVTALALSWRAPSVPAARRVAA